VLSWIFGSNGTDNGLLPLVICDLGCGIVPIRPCIELLDLSVLQLALEHKRISGHALEMQDIAYYLHVVIVCGPKSLNRLSIISKHMILICCQIQFLWLWASNCLPFGCTTVSLHCKRCFVSSTSCHFLFEFPGIKSFTCLTKEALHCTGEGLHCSLKQIEGLVGVNS